MRTWIIISSVILLIFALPGLALSLLTADWGGAAVCALLSALAVHSFYYLKVARSQPERGYLQLATGQMLLGVIVAALILKMALVINAPTTWETIKAQLQEQLQTVSQQVQAGMTQSDIQWLMQDLEQIYHQFKPIALTILLIGAVLSIASQGAFAWLLLRKRSTPEVQARDESAIAAGSNNYSNGNRGRDGSGYKDGSRTE